MKTFYRPLKRFGQNFLIDDNIRKKIIEALHLSSRDCILEIGPGRGALTSDLVRKASWVVAVEIDRGLYKNLCLQFKDAKNLDIILGDILEFNLKRYARDAKIKSFKVVANLPYYITTPVIEYLFKNIKYIDDIFVTVQKEVAQRMTAPLGTKAYGSLTCFVNYFCSPSILFKIKSGSFWPVPKVESSFVRLKPFKTSEKGFNIKSEALFFTVMRSAFGQKRKKLYTSLAKVLDKKYLRRLGLDDLFSRRPQEMALADFGLMSNLIFDFLKKR